jgi:hypothetical protein
VQYRSAQAVDIEADGRDDLLLSLYYWEEPPGEWRPGIFRTRPAGDQVAMDATPMLYDTETDEQFAGSFTALDANGDGAFDIAAGAIAEDDPVKNAGAVFLAYGPFEGSRLRGSDGAAIRGIVESQKLGTALSSGDTNGDGYDDLAIGDEIGAVWLFLGGP